MNELGEIADWVRKQAIPRLITGTDPPSSPILVRHKISRGQTDASIAVASGSLVAAYDRSRERIGAELARKDIAGTIAAIDGTPPAR